MGKVTLKLTRNGPRQLRRSGGVAADLRGRAERVSGQAGPGMNVSSTVGANRARASVVTATYDAMRAEATTRALTRAIDAAR